MDCYNNLEFVGENCLVPCKGLYADIASEISGARELEDMKEFASLIEHYEEYKRGFSRDITYPTGLKGRIYTDSRNCAIIVKLQT